MVSDYNEFIQRVLKDEVIDTIYTRSMEKLFMLFGKESPVGGDYITDEVRTSWDSNSGSYDKGEPNPTAATQVLVKPNWKKQQYHGAAAVFGIDKSNQQNGGSSIDFVRSSITREVKQIMDGIQTDVFTQMKADISATGTYSDKALSRTTHPTLVSYVEATDTAITTALMRGMINGTTLLKEVSLADYIGLIEQAVYNKFKIAAAAEITYNTQAQKVVGVDYGYQPVASFDGLDIEVISGMTTGDVFMVRKQDVIITENRPLEIEQVDSGTDTEEFVPRVGVTARVINPGNAGKMTDKD